jgi:hypothetical protein
VRPILKYRLPDALFAIPPSDLLLQTFGEYCSVSEQPLPSQHFVWHKRLAIEVAALVSQTDWRDLLLLSENSFLAQLGKLPQPLLFPDESLSFSFDGQGPIEYKLKPVEWVFRDEDGKEVAREKGDAVIAFGRTDVATATIEYFALNTQFYHPGDASFFIPLSARRSGFDRRVQQRTAAWHVATKFAEAWLQTVDQLGTNRELIESAAAQGSRLAAATGYWSTWASALAWQKVPPEHIRNILLPKPLPWEAGPGPHNPFPGTNPRVAP